MQARRDPYVVPQAIQGGARIVRDVCPELPLLGAAFFDALDRENEHGRWMCAHDLAARDHEREWAAEAATQLAYQIDAVVRGARAKRGLGAAVCELAQESRALDSEDAASSFYYEGDDLRVCVSFATLDSALGFVATLELWPLRMARAGQNPEGLRGAIEVCRRPRQVTVQELGDPVRVTDLSGPDWDSPMPSLAEFYAGMAPPALPADGVSPAELLLLYQSLERPEKFATFRAYRIRIRDRALYPELASSESNMIAGSWTPFRQAYEGLGTVGDVPLLAIRPSGTGGAVLCPNGSTRYRVWVDLVFRTHDAEQQVAVGLKQGTVRLADGFYQSFVDVEEPGLFRDCLLWRWNQTQQMWATEDSVTSTTTPGSRTD
eukprot:m51a1_g12197 hypothetical protein (376) ;mRNA; f:45210-46463